MPPSQLPAKLTKKQAKQRPFYWRNGWFKIFDEKRWKEKCVPRRCDTSWHRNPPLELSHSPWVGTRQLTWVPRPPHSTPWLSQPVDSTRGVRPVPPPPKSTALSLLFWRFVPLGVFPPRPLPPRPILSRFYEEILLNHATQFRVK